MASILKPLRCDGTEYVVVAGSFAPNGSSAVDSASNKGAGWSVVRTSAGLFTLTFQDPYTNLISCTATLQLATGDDKMVQVGTYTAPTGQTVGGTLTIRTWDISGAAETDVAANANNRVNFACVFTKSAVTT